MNGGPLWLSAVEAEALARHVMADFGVTISAAEILRLGSQEAVANRVAQLLNTSPGQPKVEESRWSMSAEKSPLLRDHRVFGRCVFPTDGYLELLAQANGSGGLLVERLHLVVPLVVDAGHEPELRLAREEQDGRTGFRFRVRDTIHASGTASSWHGEIPASARHWSVLDQAERRLSSDEIYKATESGFGPFYRSIQEIRILGDRAVARLRMTDEAVGQSASFVSAPALLDAALVTALSVARIKSGSFREKGVYLPVLLEEARIATPISAREAYALVEVVEEDSDGLVFRVSLIDDDNRVLFSCERLNARFFAREELETSNTPSDPSQKDIAIVGMSCRFPAADSLAEYWRNIRDGRDCISEAPADRWDAASVYDPDPAAPGKSYCVAGGFLKSVDQFDPLFFGIAPAEAEMMDPQQRLFLTEAWKALEDAGYSEVSLSGRHCGVFAGASTGDYMQLFDAAQSKTSEAFTGLAAAILASRVSYYLNLTGPSLSIDTACSSSLVAVRQGITSIESGDCDLAVAGGVALLLTPDLHVKTCKTGMLSPSGRCRSFDASADGIALGEGVGVVVLKPLQAALHDGDRIYAVIRGSSSNQDGRTNGITAPSGDSQRRLLRDVYERAGIDPRSIGLLEAHGTGTVLGDSVELDALCSVFPRPDDGNPYCSLTSVKSQIGHTTLAAGVAGLIKAALCIYHKALPPTLHFARGPEDGDLDGTPFRIDARTRPWSSAAPRRAAVSSFGFSGTNCHVVLEESPVGVAATQDVRGYELIALSAKTPAALQRKKADLRAWLEHRDPNTSLYQLASMLARGRSHFRRRAGMVCGNWDELAGWLDGKPVKIEASEDSSSPIEALAAYFDGDTEPLFGLYASGNHRVISLPAYPFAERRCWLDDRPQPASMHSIEVVERTAGRASYRLQLTGQEDFFAQHRVAGERVMPGVCLLEFARSAAADFLKRPIVSLCGIRWLEPVRQQRTLTELSIEVWRDGKDAAFEIRCGETTCCSGHAATSIEGGPPKAIAIRTEIEQSIRQMPGPEFYDFAAERGLRLGPLFRGLQSIHYAPGARIGRIESNAGSVPLPPGWLDGALQTALAETEGLTGGLRVPSSLDSVNIYAILPSRGWARAANRPGEESSYDITVHDDNGVVLLEFLGFRAKALLPRGSATGELLCASENWRPSKLPAAVAKTSHLLVFADEPWNSVATIVPGDQFERVSLNRWRINPSEPDHYRRLVNDVAESGELPSAVIHDLRSTQPARELFLWTKALLDHSPRAVSRIVHSGDGSPASSAVAGLGRAIALETPRIRISVAHHATREQLLAEAANDGIDAEVRFRGEQRLVRGWEEFEPNGRPGELLRREGVYLVTGGKGRIATALAQWLEREWDARVGLISRNGAGATGNIAHIAADVTNRAQLRAAIGKIHARSGPIDGVFHLAGVRRDALLSNLSFSDFDAVLAPKAEGIGALDEVLADEPLRFFVAFSSIASQFGNRGQSAYAAANRYMDAWCEWREREREAGRRSGVCRSINWPLWAEGAMRADAESERAARGAGFVPMPDADAWRALRGSLNSSSAVTTVLYGDVARLRRLLSAPTGCVEPRPAREDQIPDLLAETARIAAKILKVDPEDLDPNANLGEFGFHSINITGLAAQLGGRFRIEITPATLFEFPTLSEIARYLSSVVEDEPNPPPKVKAQVPPQAAVNSDVAIAIVGMSGRMPHSHSLDEFWDHLCNGQSCVTEIPADRWDWREYAGDAREGSNLTNVRWGAFMPQVDQFDPLFFGISPKEAASMDPQQRIMLECAWEAIEDSGTAPRALAGSDTGVFLGVSTSDYADLMKERADGVATHGSTGTAHSLLANRISYLLDLHGPSEPVDTACSSALVAIHRAVEAIRLGRCQAALAGGVNVMLSPTLFVSFAQAGMLSPDGVCRPFDAEANGYVRGEGAGVFLLKPLAAALRDGNPIHGVIRSAAVNHGGRATSLTAPNPNAQAELLSRALEEAGIDAERIDYIEAHGTGTPLGDPIEVNGLLKALGGADPAARCWLGSVKGNTGHLEAAAGCASLFKVLLSLRHREIPPSINITRLNTQLQIADTRFAIATEGRDWISRTNEAGQPLPRIAGISSFGFGGANAHLLIEEFVRESATVNNGTGPQWIVLSARDGEHLRLTAKLLAPRLETPGASVAEIAWTLQDGRDGARERMAFLADDAPSAARVLASFGAGATDIAGVFRGAANPNTTGASADFATAGEHWVNGAEVDWRSFHPQLPLKVSLPGSAFARQRCWFAESAKPLRAPILGPDAAKASTSPEPIVLEPEWRRVPQSGQDSWAGLVAVADANAEERKAFAGLGSGFEFCTADELGERATQSAEAVVLLRPSFESWRKIAAAAARSARGDTRWLLVSDGSETGPNFEMLDGVGRALLTALPRSGYCSLRARGVTSEELASLCCVELALQQAGAVTEALIENGERFVRGYRAGAGLRKRFQYRKDAVYLVTGGLGSLGSAVARRMLASGSAVALIGRSEPDERRAERLADLRTFGRVMYCRTDAADPRQLAAALRGVRGKWGPIHGVVHAAGLLGSSKLAEKLQVEWDAVLRSKVDAALALDAATANDPLEFFVVFSSLASAVGDLGQGDYAAANRFLDAFALERAKRGPGRSLSVGWGLWRETGLTPVDHIDEWEEATGLRALDSEQALDTLELLLASDSGHVLVTSGDVSALTSPASSAELGRLADREFTRNEPDRALEQRISELVHRLLQLPEGTLSSDSRLQEFGLDSILLNQLSQSLEQCFGPIPKSVLLENDSVRCLAAYYDRTESVSNRPSPQELHPAAEPIAVIGLTGRYPGAASLDELWKNLCDGKSAIVDLPSSRWPDLDDSDLRCRLGGFLEDVDQFDPVFFGITPAEAAAMKPEERLLLELSNDAIESAAHAAGDEHLRRAGVYMAVTANTYALHGQVSADTSLFGLANRVSHALGCRGPSLTLDTGCCSALAAIHLACEALRSDAVPMAVAGAVNLLLHPAKFRLLQTNGLISAAKHDGLFPADASGFVPGEGGGVVVLTTLSRALKNGDYIWGLIEASALSHQGGYRNYRLPSPSSFREHLADLLDRSGIGPDRINYVELQAPGAELVDASEWTALTATAGSEGPPCPVGSVKLAMGHLEAASGMAQLTKVLLQLRHGEIPPGSLSASPNAEVTENRSRFYFPSGRMAWEVSGEKRRALITSSGVGGSLSSLIVSEAPPNEPMPAEAQPLLLVVSAKTAGQLNRRKDDLLSYLASVSPRPSLADVCFTLQQGRTHHRHRAAWIVRSWEELLTGNAPSWQGRIDSTAEIQTPSGIEEVATAWVAGAAIPDRSLARGRRVPLPAYPYERIRCWLDTAAQSEPESGAIQAGPASVVAGYYNRVAGAVASEVRDQDVHLVFAPFPERIPGFRWLQTFFEPDQHPEHYERMLQAQRELKELLFSGVNWTKCRQVLDIGCGFATDLINLAKKHPQLRGAGYTITSKQAELGKQRVASAGIAGRMEVFERDSARDEFEGEYDAALAFEVLFHIRDKKAVFENLARHLRPGGTLLIADCLANTVASINHDSVGLFTCRASEFASLLAECRFEVTRAIDAGPEMSHFLADEDFDATLARLRSRHPELGEKEAEHRAWNNCGKAFAMGLIRYILLTAEFHPEQPTAILTSRNLSKLASAERYTDGVEAQATKQSEAPRASAGELRKLAAEVIGIPGERIESDIPLAEFGVDSLVGLKLLDTINRRFGIELEMQTLFDCPTIEALARRVEAAHPVPMSQLVATPEPVEADIRPGALPAPSTNEPIAIVGMAGRFPGAPDIETYWQNIVAGVDSVTEIPSNRWDVEAFYDPDPNQPGRSYSRWGGFLDGVDKFDAAFFRITRAEAEVMDPQQRLFLETCWEALENAGYAGPALKGASCGVVAGVFNNDYRTMLGKTPGGRNLGHAMLGNADSILAARVSYLLDLKGPALSVDSACSSSLVAVHLACQSLRTGEADVMLAGGVTLYLDETPYLMMSKSGMLSPTGRCRSFAERADGIAVGEAVGVVVLKRLSDALADRDTIRGVIRGSGVNQDGQTNGITAPSSESQKSLLSSVYRRFAINPETIGCVEAHGTGTKLGDPVEMAALTAAFREHTERIGYCALGSVKSNIGHSSAAAGIAGLIKATLAVYEGKIPPSIHSDDPNHLLRLDASPFYLPGEARTWAGPRRAAVSAFGFSGTNCHLVLDQPPDLGQSEPDCESIVTISAGTQPQLRQLARRLHEWTGRNSGLRVCDIAWTLDSGRARLAEKVQFRAATLTELRETLSAYIDQRSAAGVFPGGGQAQLPFPSDVRRVPLPTYPFAHERFWFRTESVPVAAHPRHREVELSVDSEILLREHKVFGRHSLPADALLDIVYRHGAEILGLQALRVRDVAFFTPLFCEPSETRRMTVEAVGDSPVRMEIASTGSTGQRQRHLAAVVEPEGERTPAAAGPPESQPLAKATGNAIFGEGQALEVGEFFHSLGEVIFWPGQVRATLTLSEPARREAARFSLHPAILDSLFGLANCLALRDSTESGVAYIPYCIQDLKVFAPLGDFEYRAAINIVNHGTEYVRFDAELIDPRGTVAVAIRGLDLRRVSEASFQQQPTALPSDDHSRPKLRLKPVGPTNDSPRPARTELQPAPSRNSASPSREHLRDLLAEVMLCDASVLDPGKSLVEQGVDSILGLEFVQRINREFGLRLQGTILFEHPTLDGLADALANTEMPSSEEAKPRETKHPESPSAPESEGDFIAIIGMAGRFPGARTLDELWRHLESNHYLIRDVPIDHWDYRPHFNPGKPGGMYCKRGAFIDGLDLFDPLFFNISPREAETMDPQLRLFFEVLWETFEDAGYPGRIRGTRTGVYLGNCYNDYLDLMKHHAGLDLQFAGSGNSNSMLSNRVSFYFDLTGPCMTLDTACSSSLVALHLAAQALKRGECEMAIAGGVNLNLSPSKYLNFCAIGAFSKSGEIRPFSENADGYLPGEGVAAILLKPLGAALRDGDRIHGILRGSAVRCAGKSPGPTVPNHAIETETMVDAWRDAGIDPETLTYLEAHGTGTRVGDPLEINAIKRAFSRFTGNIGFCRVGTIKANIGHAEATAGLAGVIKTLLQMRRHTIAGMPGLLPLNSMIEIAGSALVLDAATSQWLPLNGTPLRAGVSSFGMGGTYAHAVLEEYVDHRPSTPAGDSRYPILISARTPEALRESARRLAAHLETHPNLQLADVAHTLHFGRERMEETIAFRAASIGDLLKQLRAENLEAVSRSTNEPEPPTGGRLISLPSYPFQRERYWLPISDVQASPSNRTWTPDWAAAADGKGLVFHAEFEPAHPLLDQHRVNGEPILPAAASLLLVLEAASQFQPGSNWQLRHVVWQSPVGPGRLELRFQLRENGYEWRLAHELGDEHVRGIVEDLAGQTTPRLDQTTQIAGSVPNISGIDVPSLYASFESAGIAYGPAFRNLQSLSIGDGQVAGEWEAEAGTPEAAILDSALQSASALFSKTPTGPVVPWSLASAIRHNALPDAGHCVVRKTGEGRFDAVVSDRDGNVCVEMEGFAVRPLPAAPRASVGLYQWAWQSAELPPSRLPRHAHRALIVAPEPRGHIAKELETALPAAAVVNSADAGFLRDGGTPEEVWFAAGAANSAAEAENQARLYYKLVRSLCVASLAQQPLCLRVLAGGALGAALTALARSTANEFPRWSVSAIELDAASISRDIILQLGREPALAPGEERAFRDGDRMIRRLQPTSLGNSTESPLRQQCVVLIAGGARGIGYETALWLARSHKAHLILLGRRPLADPIWDRIRKLEQEGARALYVRADLGDLPALRRAIDLGRAEFGPVEGVVHSAMVLSDGLLASLDENAFSQPLRPKMSGLENLREVLRDDPLAFALIHSSAQSLLGNAGQGNYAAASAFADRFADIWRSEVSYPVKTVNWSYWGGVGAVASDEYRRRMRAIGVESIEPGEAFPIVERLLGSPTVHQIYAIKAAESFLRLLRGDATARKPAASANGTSTLLQRSLALLREAR